MKLKKGYILRQVADMHVVLPLNAPNIDFRGMITLNASGVVLWKALEKGADEKDLINALTSEYEVSEEQVVVDVKEFLKTLTQIGCLEV